MKNSTEYLRKCKVPKYSEAMSSERLEKDKAGDVEKRNAWGSNDFKSLIHKNMEGYKKKESNNE